MSIREATIKDIPGLFSVRMSVKENVLNTPALVTDEICADYLVNKGKGWVYEADNKIVGFAIVDIIENSVWALFVRPEYEGRGIGFRLHNTMMSWYFTQTTITAWLTTDTGTRAEQFYLKAGWRKTGKAKGNEVKLEMNLAGWNKLYAANIS